VLSFGLLSWALFIAALRIDKIFEIVRRFNEARSPISQLQTSVDGIKDTLAQVSLTVETVKQSAREFDSSMSVLREFNDRFKALTDQVIGLQEEAVSQRSEPAGAAQGAAAPADNDELNWEEFRTLWRRNNQRLEAIIGGLSAAKQRRYAKYPRTDYPSIIEHLFEDLALSHTAREKSAELHKMFMSYKPRNRAVTDEVVAAARLLDEQLAELVGRAPVDADT